MIWKPWTFFAVAIAGWMNRQQPEVISYLTEENLILREKLGSKRIILNDSQKRRRAAVGMKLGKDLMRQFGTLFSPDTLLRWQCVRRRLGYRQEPVPRDTQPVAPGVAGGLGAQAPGPTCIGTLRPPGGSAPTAGRVAID
jgi:hypothetical protein